MGFNCGIVGLPNVGKSTLFNALTATAAAESANYPFCTIEPNVGRVGVPDPRLDTIARIGGSQKIIPTTLEFVDIAGLVRGASKGEGLGNQFLGHIRSVDAIIHVVRCFEDDNITHVEGSVDPLRDKEIIETELMLSDMESLEKRQIALSKKLRSKDADAQEQMDIVERVLTIIQAGSPARTFIPKESEKALFEDLHLLTAKPILYVCNVKEEEAATGNSHTQKVKVMAEAENAKMVVISANIETEIATLSEEEQKEFLESLGLSEKGLSQVIHQGYSLLGLLTFFTVGPKEARAWTIEKGATAPQAAGKIHSDFERGFICADTIAYDDFVANNGESGAKDAGKLRQEGRNYIACDGDIFHFKFNV
jgi:GTP-binding protein YchF